MIHLKLAAYLSLLWLSAVFLVRYAGPQILEHDREMVEDSRYRAEEARWEAFRACLRKHTVRECRE